VSGGAVAASLDLRRQRVSKGLRAADVAAELRVHPMSVLRWERRERFPEPGQIVGLARVLEVETGRVIGFFDEARRPAGRLGTDGRGLRVVRLRHGASVARLAAAAGVPPSTVYNWESGRARIPDRALDLLSRELGTTPQVLSSLLRGARVPARPAVVPRTALQGLRERACLSQSEVAARIGVSRRIVGAWEAATRARPPLWALRRLARVYQVPVRDVARAAGVVAPVALDPGRWPELPLVVVLRTLREWRRLTQADVARHCGRSVAAVRAWEAGRHHPDASSRDALARLYGVSACAFPRAGSPGAVSH